MAAKETVRSKLDKLRGRSARGETVSLDASALLSPMRLDKKNLGQTLRIILLKSIGQCYVENTSVDWFASLENYL